VATPRDGDLMSPTAGAILQALQLLAALQDSNAKNDAIVYHGFAIRRAQEDLKQLLNEYAPPTFVHWRICRPLVPREGTRDS
jgi:hypothetical protein